MCGLKKGIFWGVWLSVSLLSLVDAKEYRVSSQEQFEAVNELTFQAGDSILLQRGKVFKGMLAPKGSGDESALIRLGAFGQGSRPRIDAEGKNKAGVFLHNASYWFIEGLEITNTDGSDEDQGQLFGIYVLADGEEKVYRKIAINDCYIHDVNGKVAGKRRGGIHVHLDKLKESIIDNLRITNNRIYKVGGVGIGNDSSASKIEFLEDKAKSSYLWTNVYVAGNHLDQTGRNNVIARCSVDAIYEHNTLANSSRYDTGHSIFCFKTKGIKIQYNEAYGNVGDGGKDRGGFDADFNCVDTYIQYNYSHDNLWFCGIMKKPNRNVVIRYNISQNDREGIYFYGFDSKKEAENIHIYNNTHFVKKDLHVHVFPENRKPLNTLFENNIFYFEGKGFWGSGGKKKAINTRFNNNLYYGIEPHPLDQNAVVANPQFVNGGKAGTGIDLRTMKDLIDYRLKMRSPAFQAGVPILNNGGLDFFKVPVGHRQVSIGAAER